MTDFTGDRFDCYIGLASIPAVAARALNTGIKVAEDRAGVEKVCQRREFAEKFSMVPTVGEIGTTVGPEEKGPFTRIPRGRGWKLQPEAVAQKR